MQSSQTKEELSPQRTYTKKSTRCHSHLIANDEREYGYWILLIWMLGTPIWDGPG